MNDIHRGPLLADKSSVDGTADCQGTIRVLAVDDELPIRRLFSVIFGQPAFHCVTAGDGEQALAALQCEPFDVVISDLCMPGMGGMELLDRVRREHPHMAFLVTTGVDDVEVGVQAMRSGADDYLVKPIVESAVLVSIERALQKHYLEQQVEDYRRHLEQMVAERTGQLQAALQQIKDSYESTLQALGAAIDLRDHGTAGHSERVCRYSLEIARVMGWSEEKLVSLARGAYLHDIGKLGIPDNILLNPGPLTADEWKIMQQHVQIGFDLVKDITFLADAAGIILTHHERYDGSGYLRGLRRAEILLDARIFAVADTLDAITSDRPYHRACSFETGRDTIAREAGRLFDPEVVKAFLSISADSWLETAKSQSSTAALAPWP